MKKILRKIENIIAPTEKNDGTPWVLSKKASFVFVAIAFTFVLPSVYFQASFLASLLGPAPFQSENIVELVNDSRVTSGLPALQESTTLSVAAENKLRHMVENGYFAHFAPDGTSPWFFIRGAGYDYYAAGENLAVDFASSESVHGALMNSPTHRSNILNPLYSEIGVAVARASYSGREAVYVVQMFGSPSSSTNLADSTGSSEIDPSGSEAEESSGDNVLAQGDLPDHSPEDSEDSSDPEDPVSESEEQDLPQEDPEEEPLVVDDFENGEGDVPGTEEEDSSEPTEQDEREEEVVHSEEEPAPETVENVLAEELSDRKNSLLPIISSAIKSHTESGKARAIASLTVVALLIVAMALLLVRGERMSFEMGVRTFLILLVFGYVLFQPHYLTPASDITPAAKTDVAYEMVR